MKINEQGDLVGYGATVNEEAIKALKDAVEADRDAMMPDGSGRSLRRTRALRFIDDYGDEFLAALEGQRWRPMTEAPEVERGGEMFVTVAIRRKHNGRVYSLPAVVANNLELYSETPHEASGPNWSQRVIESGENNIAVTGWYDYGADAEYDYSYTPLCQEGDELVGWQPLPAPPQSKAVLTLENAPLGTKAPAIMGGHWVRVERGWKWHSGDTFPRPGGDWTGELIPPPEGEG